MINKFFVIMSSLMVMNLPMNLNQYVIDDLNSMKTFSFKYQFEKKEKAEGAMFLWGRFQIVKENNFNITHNYSTKLPMTTYSPINLVIKEINKNQNYTRKELQYIIDEIKKNDDRFNMEEKMSSPIFTVNFDNNEDSYGIHAFFVLGLDVCKYSYNIEITKEGTTESFLVKYFTFRQYLTTYKQFKTEEEFTSYLNENEVMIYEV